jgi:hypothetical protein
VVPGNNLVVVKMEAVAFIVVGFFLIDEGTKKLVKVWNRWEERRERELRYQLEEELKEELLEQAREEALVPTCWNEARKENARTL